MKKLGLIGGTGPESTLLYYKALTGKVLQAAEVFPYLTIESLSVYDIFYFCEQKDYAGLTEYLVKGIKNLAAAGCDLAAFTGVTPHLVFAEVQKQSPIPLISMVDTACQAAQQAGYHKVALLGTEPTMVGSFFTEPFQAAGIEVIIPNELERFYIQEKIATELELGQVKQDTVRELAKIAAKLVMRGAEAIVLGCTELPLAFASIDLPVAKLDVMQVHIEELCQRIVEK